MNLFILIFEHLFHFNYFFFTNDIYAIHTIKSINTIECINAIYHNFCSRKNDEKKKKEKKRKRRLNTRRHFRRATSRDWITIDERSRKGGRIHRYIFFPSMRFFQPRDYCHGKFNCGSFRERERD